MEAPALALVCEVYRQPTMQVSLCRQVLFVQRQRGLPGLVAVCTRRVRFKVWPRHARHRNICRASSCGLLDL